MNPTIALLRSYNHHENPMIRAAFVHLTGEDWDRMTPDDPLGQLLVCSFEQAMAPVHEKLCWKHHGRPPLNDGIVGPATAELLTVERCGCPDFEALTDMEATGNGSWQPHCNPAVYKDHSVKIHYDLSRASAQVKSWWPQIRDYVHGAYAECGMGLIETQVKSEANITVWFENLDGSIIGLAQLPGSNVACNRVVWCKLDPGYRPSWNLVAQLLAHEIAHNMNSGHISSDRIMGSVIDNGFVWNGSFLGTPLGNRLQGYFGKEPAVPIGQPPTVPPTQPPTDRKYILTGMLTLEDVHTGEQFGDFIVVPRGPK